MDGDDEFIIVGTPDGTRDGCNDGHILGSYDGDGIELASDDG